VRADVILAGKRAPSVWLEDPYEEKEFWSDASEAIVSASEDPPGRISNRGAWLQLRCAEFLGVPDKGNGYWDVEDARH
jgi:hypothetical protein